MEAAAAIGMPDTLAEAAIMADVILAAIPDTITAGMRHEGPSSALFSAEESLEASTVHTGGLTMRYRYFQAIMIHTISIPMLRLRT